MGDPEAGPGQIRQQVSRDLQRREQTQAVHGDGLDRMSSRHFSGKEERQLYEMRRFLSSFRASPPLLLRTQPSGGSRSRCLPVTGLVPASCASSGLSVPLRSLTGANKVTVAQQKSFQRTEKRGATRIKTTGWKRPTVPSRRSTSSKIKVVHQKTCRNVEDFSSCPSGWGQMDRPHCRQCKVHKRNRK